MMPKEQLLKNPWLLPLIIAYKEGFTGLDEISDYLGIAKKRSKSLIYYAGKKNLHPDSIMGILDCYEKIDPKTYGALSGRNIIVARIRKKTIVAYTIPINALINNNIPKNVPLWAINASIRIFRKCRKKG